MLWLIGCCAHAQVLFACEPEWAALAKVLMPQAKINIAKENLRTAFEYLSHESKGQGQTDVDEAKKKKWIQKVDMKKGAFTDYCGGKVTQDCIDKAMKSDDAHVVHMATLAKNLRKIAKV